MGTGQSVAAWFRRAAQETWQYLQIIALAVAAACLYGIVHDQFTARICVEYFTVFHPPVFKTDSPTLLAFGWGVIATWWVGLPLGIMAALCSRVGSAPKLTALDLLRPLEVVLAVMAVAAFIAGVAGYMAVSRGLVEVDPWVAQDLPAARHARFMADFWAHNTSYAVGFWGGVGLCIWCLLARWKRSQARGASARGRATTMD